jgi:hypothetical protein
MQRRDFLAAVLCGAWLVRHRNASAHKPVQGVYVERPAPEKPHKGKVLLAVQAHSGKGPGGRHGSRLRAELAKKRQRLPLLGDDDATADRNYIKEFLLARNSELGRKHGVEYAEAFHYIGPGAPSPVEDYVRKNVVPVGG